MNELSTRRFALISGADSGYSAGDWLDRNMPKGIVSSNATVAFEYSLYGRIGITELYLPEMLDIYNSAFASCTNLAKVYLPSCWRLGPGALGYNHVEILVLPKVRVIGNFSIRGCGRLTTVDLGYNATQTPTFGGGDAFEYCSKLNTLILRSEKMWTISRVDNFADTPFASGKSGGTIYVPGALIDTYKAHSTWGAILGYGGGAQNQILPIEGSIYETQYADGTPIEGD